MSEPLVADEDREKAADVLAAILEDDDTQFSSLTLIAMALARERASARAPFLTLMDELYAESRACTSDVRTWALMDAADRIRQVLRDG